MNGEPLFIIRLKDERVEPEHEELVRLTLSTGSSYQSPPQNPPPPPPPELPPHPSLLQLMPLSSSSRSSELMPESLPHQSFSQPSSQFSSRPPLKKQRILVTPSSQPSLSPSQPSSSSQFIGPPPGFPFPQELPTSPQQSSSEQKPQPPADQAESSEPSQPSEGQAHPSGTRRARNYRKKGWQLNIKPPYPWASSLRAKVLSMEQLLSQEITVISGDVSCKFCKKQFQIDYDLRTKFSEVVCFISRNMEDMHDRAPAVWAKPEDLDCNLCGKSKCVQPVIPAEKKTTNWLFLFLGQMIGHCNLTHLKHFCKYNEHHRTAAKDRLIYLIYTNLHCQLDPRASRLYNKDK